MRLSAMSSVLRTTTLLVSLVTLWHAHIGEAAMYNEYVTELDPQNFDTLVMQSTETWLVKFYAPWCGHCQSSAPAFSKAAKKLEGVARLGVVNCDDHKDIAQRFGVQGFPTIKVFKGEGRKARRPSNYEQARSSKAFVDHVKYVMPSFVARVKPSGVDAFFKDLPSLPHVLLFTDKSSTSPLYKGMSAKFKGKVSFGEVRKSDAGDIQDKYAVSTYPTLIAFKPGESDPDTAVLFTGSMDPKSLDSFFGSTASGDAADTGDGQGAGASEKDQKEKVFAQPQAYSGDVHTIHNTREYGELCDARKDGRMCGLALLPAGQDHGLVTGLKNVAEKYQYDNLAFAVIDSSAEGGDAYAELFGVDKGSGGFLVMRARKRKYALLSEEPTEQSISSFLDRVVGGDARWKKLSVDLPIWEADSAGTEEETTSQNKSTEGDPADESEESGQCGTEPPKDGESCGGSKDDL